MWLQTTASDAAATTRDTDSHAQYQVDSPQPVSGGTCKYNPLDIPAFDSACVTWWLNLSKKCILNLKLVLRLFSTKSLDATIQRCPLYICEKFPSISQHKIA